MKKTEKINVIFYKLLFTLIMLLLTACTNQVETQEAITEECPYAMSGQEEWSLYPKDNIFGLKAIAFDKGTETTTVVMAFAYQDASEDIDQKIIREADYVTGSCRYGYFTIEGDDYDLSLQKHSFYVRLIYDNRIEFQGVCFDKDDERDVVNLLNGLELIYCDFRNIQESAWVNQKYLEEDRAWGQKVPRSEKRDMGSTIDPVIYTKLAIVETDGYFPTYEENGLTISVYDYEFNMATHNIYGEVTNEQKATIKFWMLWANESEKIESLEGLALYVKKDGQYVDMTPEDMEVSMETVHENRVNVYLSTHLLELDEGDYMLEIDGNYVEFRIENQTFEAW